MSRTRFFWFRINVHGDARVIAPFEMPHHSCLVVFDDVAAVHAVAGAAGTTRGIWKRIRDSNSCYRRERAAYWTPRRMRHDGVGRGKIPKGLSADD